MARKSLPKGTTEQGKVLSLLRANGDWLAVVSMFRSEPGLPVVSHLLPISELKGSARKKADRWAGVLS